MILLQCANCSNIREWNRDSGNPPGSCYCRSKRPWNFIKERPKKTRGYVRVISHLGTQELKGPSYLEDPDGWK